MSCGMPQPHPHCIISCHSGCNLLLFAFTSQACLAAGESLPPLQPNRPAAPQPPNPTPPPSQLARPPRHQSRMPPQASQPPSSPTCCTKKPVKKRDALEFRRACVWGPTDTVHALPQTQASLPPSTPNLLGTLSHDHMMLQEAFGAQGGTPWGPAGVSLLVPRTSPLHTALHV